MENENVCGSAISSLVGWFGFILFGFQLQFTHNSNQKRREFFVVVTNTALMENELLMGMLEWFIFIIMWFFN